MTSGGKRPGAPLAEAYSPRRRSAVVFVGTGTAGAYHAGVLRALHEAGTKIDVVAGQGIGAASALLSAIDLGPTLWSDTGLWRAKAVAHLYSWNPVVRVLGAGVAVAALLVLAPLALVAAGLVVAGQMVGLSGGGLAAGFARFSTAAFEPTALPTWLPRLVVVALGGAGLVAVASSVARVRGRRPRGPLWWRLLPPPFSATPAVAHCWSVFWNSVRGASDVRQPTARDLARRYTELLAENLGQPGFRELMLGVHDLDTHRDVIFALVTDDRRAALTRRETSAETDARRGEVIDLCAFSKEHVADALAAALAVPVVTSPHPTTFAADGYWRGETHRLCDRAGVLHRLFDELLALGVEQIVLVSAAPEVATPHALVAPRLDGRGRIGEYVQASEAATVRDVVRQAQVRGTHLHVIRPTHNPVGPFDFRGGFDDRSDRLQSVAELTAQGYEDAHRQFVEPVMGPSGDRLS
jgi:hypothetical protein